MRTWTGFQKGIDLGGWLSQFAKYDIQHFETFITKEDFKTIAESGFDHVRIPVDFNVLESDDEKAERVEIGYKKLHEAISWAREYHLNMILDLHEIYGYSFDPLKVNMDREKFFYDEALQARFRALWDKITKEFKDDTDILAFELLNEVVLETVYDAWNKVIAHTIPVIRANCPKAWIVVGGVNYNSVHSVPLLDKPYDDRIVYNFHCYEPYPFTHQGNYWDGVMPRDFRIEYPGTLEEYERVSETLRPDFAKLIKAGMIPDIQEGLFETTFKPAVEVAERYNVPLYCGEYGVIDQAPVESTVRWFETIHKVFVKYGIGRAIWNYKNKDFGIFDKHYDPVRKELLKNI